MVQTTPNRHLQAYITATMYACSYVYVAVSPTVIMKGHIHMPTTLLHRACVWRLGLTALPYQDNAQITPKLLMHCKPLCFQALRCVAQPIVCSLRFSKLQVLHVCFHLSSGASMAIWASTCACGHSRSAFTHRSPWRLGGQVPYPIHAIAGGFQTVALVGFIAPLAVTLLGPATGQLLDHSPRQLALNTCALVQGGCIIVSGESLPLLQPPLHWSAYN